MKLSLIHSHATLVLVWQVQKSWLNSHANSRLSALMQLLFSFDQDMRVDETLMQTLACQLSCNSTLVWPGHESWWNSHANSRLWTLTQFLFSFDADFKEPRHWLSHVKCCSFQQRLLFWSTRLVQWWAVFLRSNRNLLVLSGNSWENSI